MTRQKWVWASQILLGLAVGWFVWRALARQWSEFLHLDWSMIAPRPGLLAGSACIVFTTYALLIAAWRSILLGWGERFSFRTAIHVWAVSNLGRYLPGKLWSVAGLAVLSRRAGVSGLASIGAAVAMQAVAVGTAAAVAATMVPAVLNLWQLGIALLLAFGVISLLANPRALAALRRINNGTGTLRSLPVHVAVVSSIVMTLSWVGYGVAFWLLAHGLLTDVDLTLRLAIGVFAVGYVVGLLALFAPGGIGVREAVYVAMLTPAMGSGAALALAAGSRLLLTTTELAAAVVGAVLRESDDQMTIAALREDDGHE